MRSKGGLKKSSPTLRERDRYVYFKIISEEPVGYPDVEAAIWNTLLDFYGELGMSQTSMWLVRNLWNPQEQSGVIKCNNLSVPQVVAGLGFISRLGEIRVVFKILNVSGTIKGLAGSKS
jgi:ribonuclease P/MRP protein subunit POP5